MENITLLQIAEALAFIVGLIGSVVYLKKMLIKSIDKTLQPFNERIDKLELRSIKTDLVNFMSYAEFGNVSEEQKLNAYELYDKYCKLGGNSYIHDKWENLKKDNKI